MSDDQRREEENVVALVKTEEELSTDCDDQSMISNNRSVNKNSSSTCDLRLNEIRDDDNLDHEQEQRLKRKVTCLAEESVPVSKRIKNEEFTSHEPEAIEDDRQKSTSKIVIESEDDLSEDDLSEDDPLDDVTPKGISNVGPLPPEGSSIFKGIRFIIVTTPQIDLLNAPPLWTEKRRKEAGFSKIHIIKQISLGGGINVRNTDDIDWFEIGSQSKPDIYLIAETFNSSKVYFNAVAANLPCVTHEWVNVCCRQNKWVDHYPFLLPTGRSLMSGELVHWHGHREIFLGHQFAVMSRNEKSLTSQYWRDVLKLAGGTIVPADCLYYSGMKAFAVMIDDYYSNEEIRQLKANKIKMLTTDWVVESIVHGHKILCEGYHSFMIYFDETDQNESDRFSWHAK